MGINRPHGWAEMKLIFAILVAASVAGSIASILDPPIVEEPVFSYLEGLAISLAIAVGAAIVGTLLGLGARRLDRGQVAGPTNGVGIGVAAIVGILVYSEILEEMSEIPAGADLGAPPTFSIEGVLIMVGLLVVLGGVIYLRRRAGA